MATPLRILVVEDEERIRQFLQRGLSYEGYRVDIAEDGQTDLLIYHARSYRDLIGDPLSDPNRHARIRKITWDENGFPDFGQDLDD